MAPPVQRALSCVPSTCSRHAEIRSPQTTFNEAATTRLAASHPRRTRSTSPTIGRLTGAPGSRVRRWSRLEAVPGSPAASSPHRYWPRA